MLEYGRQALEDNKKGVATEALEQVVLAIVVTTAIVSIFLTRDFTPDYNSGLAHACFYALTAYPVIEKEHLHGEVVGFGVLYALSLIHICPSRYRHCWSVGNRPYSGHMPPVSPPQCLLALPQSD